MGKSYEQLSLEDPIALAQFRAEGLSIRKIAAAPDRSPSTVARWRRNSGWSTAPSPCAVPQVWRIRNPKQ
jgi:IS30 family transposase